MYTHKYSTYTHMEAMTRGAEGCVCRTNRLDCSCCARNTKSSGPPIHQHIYIYTASPRWTTPIQLLMVVVLFVSLARSLSLFDVYHTRTSTGMSARDASCFFVLSPLYNEFLSRLAANRSCPPRRPHDGCDSSGDERGGHRAIFAATVS